MIYFVIYVACAFLTALVCGFVASKMDDLHLYSISPLIAIVWPLSWCLAILYAILMGWAAVGQYIAREDK